MESVPVQRSVVDLPAEYDDIMRQYIAAAETLRAEETSLQEANEEVAQFIAAAAQRRVDKDAIIRAKQAELEEVRRRLNEEDMRNEELQLMYAATCERRRALEQKARA